MNGFLKNHPFAVEAFFVSSVVLAFVAPKEELRSLIPECLEIDSLNDQWGFIAVAMVQTSGLRPKGFPKLLGRDFFLIGYRIFVRYTTSEGKHLRGLYILKSETDKRTMQFFGNIFTHYKYTTTDIQHTIQGNIHTIKSAQSDFEIEIEETDETVVLPEGSPCADWKEARKFAGPLPNTFTYNKAKKEVLIIEGIRRHWKPSPIKVNHYQIAFLDSLQLSEVKLANAFIVKDIPYAWKKGRIDQCKG